MPYLDVVITGTQDGSIGVIASLPKIAFDFLEALQRSLRKVIKGVGGFDHAQFRTFSTDSREEISKGMLNMTLCHH